MMSAINYFTRDRALLILKDIHRILKPSGILRVGVQDLKLISKKYIDKDREFFFRKKLMEETDFLINICRQIQLFFL